MHRYARPTPEETLLDLPTFFTTTHLRSLLLYHNLTNIIAYHSGRTRLALDWHDRSLNAVTSRSYLGGHPNLLASLFSMS